MSILTRVLIGLVVLSVFPLLYFTAATLKLHENWQSRAQRLIADVARAQTDVDLLRYGDAKNRGKIFDPEKLPDGRPGVGQLQTARDNLMLGRGRFWYAQRLPDSVDRANGKFSIQMVRDPLLDGQKSPLATHGIKEKSFVYLFQLKHDQTQDGAFPSVDDRYVGEFVVDAVKPSEKDPAQPSEQLTLRPAVPYGDVAAIAEPKWAALEGGSGEWIVYEHMPIDDHNVFRNYTEDKIRALLPPSVVAEYLNDDKPPTDEVLNDERLKQFIAEDPNNPSVKKFLRPLRDYQQIFRNAALRAQAIDDRLKLVLGEKAYAEAAEKQMNEQIAKLDERKAKLEQEKARLDAEHALILAHSQQLTALVAQVQQDLQTTLAENRRLADEAAGRLKTAAVAPLEAAARTP